MTRLTYVLCLTLIKSFILGYEYDEEHHHSPIKPFQKTQPFLQQHNYPTDFQDYTKQTCQKIYSKALLFLYFFTFPNFISQISEENPL